MNYTLDSSGERITFAGNLNGNYHEFWYYSEYQKKSWKFTHQAVAGNLVLKQVFYILKKIIQNRILNLKNKIIKNIIEINLLKLFLFLI